MACDLSPLCPAASSIQGASSGRGGVVCGVLRVDDEARDSILTSSALDPLLDEQTDPSVIYNFCCGTALPIVTRDENNRHAHYTNCDVWQRHILRTRFAHLPNAGLGLDATEPVGHARAAAFDEAARDVYTPVAEHSSSRQAVDELAGWDVG